MITAQIVRIEQCLDLKRKSWEHVVKLELPNGSVIDAIVNETAVERLMQMLATDEAAPAAESFTQYAPEDTGARAPESNLMPSARLCFVDTGGMYDGESVRIFGSPEESDSEPPAPAQGQPLRLPQQVRIRTVPKNEYGYPVVSGGVGAASVLSEAMDGEVPQI